MIDIKSVIEIIEEHVKDSELFLVEAEIGEGNLIQIVLDSTKNVSIGDCIELSKFIENKLDREVEDYELQVASAGVGEPLKLPQQFEKNIERWVEVLDKKGIKQAGTLKSFANNTASIEITRLMKLEGKKRKQEVTAIEEFKLDQVKQIVVVPDIGRKTKKKK
jgi:ribosome maturation factor RimP